MNRTPTPPRSIPPRETVLAYWHAGFDTAGIAKRLRVEEADVERVIWAERQERHAHGLTRAQRGPGGVRGWR